MGGSVLLMGIYLDGVPWLFYGAILVAIQYQCIFGLFPVLISLEVPAGEPRSGAMRNLMSFQSLGDASGTALQMLVTPCVGSQWHAGELHLAL